jgi:hypothetical protein
MHHLVEVVAMPRAEDDVGRLMADKKDAGGPIAGQAIDCFREIAPGSILTNRHSVKS